MRFQDYKYERPNYEAVKEEYTALVEDLKNAESKEQALETVEKIIKIDGTIDTQLTLWSIRSSIDTNDEFYKEETNFWNEYMPLFAELNNLYYAAVLDSTYREDLKEVLPETFFMLAENARKTFSPEIIELLQKENELVDAYKNLIASAQLDFQGKTYTLAQLTPCMQDTDRETRKEAYRVYAGFFEENEEKFDEIYDGLVKTRDQIAKTLGFKDYVEYGYYNMNRFDYNREDVKVYRQEILKHVVPVVDSLYKRQAKRIDVPELKAYDMSLEFLDGNAVPQGDPDFIVGEGVKMYHELSKETGEFIDFMMQHELLDLVAKKGKQSGGYCTYINDYKSPFIFSNFNGTSGDVDVLTHEAGHAFQVFRSRWIKSPEVLWPTYESCEIHSMSMEFFAWPWMENFFKHQVDKYKFSHLSGALTFLPYGVLVDHFQHEVYEHPEMTPAERKAKWRELEKMYLPMKDYEDVEVFNRGAFWFKQGHIFSTPFYYIDYTLAQVCALQFWKRAIVDHDEKAWEDYLRICDLGGTKSFLQIVEAANLRSPFQEGALTDIIGSANDYLLAIDDTKL
ncbi:oligoendopeptidase, M3 family [Granulicatella balaenopterae]|uniref:Oligoendopeptidase, M3 family n=1 Tax=Granulicatella balaenopterae TaxID=137733 RepID=A0A1H9GXZ2_9LACT|nr:M3 family oligoendopeptidase [Granulicatella balaenopterae]SEQ54992.1 oligoendopeptidase, M3 family [Granulicatella balaenopterae]